MRRNKRIRLIASRREHLRSRRAGCEWKDLGRHELPEVVTKKEDERPDVVPEASLPSGQSANIGVIGFKSA